MIRKGLKFRVSRNIGELELDEAAKRKLVEAKVLDPMILSTGAYVVPGRIVKGGPADGLFKVRGLKWRDSGLPVYGKPMVVTGWSRTNMPYVEEGRRTFAVWFEDAKAYTAKVTPSLMSKLRRQLDKLGVVVGKIDPASDDADAAINLLGAYDGVHLQVGDSYYQVVRETAAGNFVFVDGKGDLKQELKQALAHSA